MREGDADESIRFPVEAQAEHDNIFNDIPEVAQFPDFNYIPPPDLQDLEHSTSSTENEIITPRQQDLEFAGDFGLLPMVDLG